MPLRPRGHFVQNGTEAGTKHGKRVLHLQMRLTHHRAGHESIAFQLAQLLSQYLVSHLRLVSDQDKALDFYTNVIGLEKRGDYRTPDGPRFLTVGVKGHDFELVLWPGTPGRAKAGSAVYTIEVENCQIAFETLKSRGVKFEASEILKFPWGDAARFQDPDGNLLQLREGRGAFRR
jgi:predicted enzyme related to lactoylglutathione lyase